MTHRVSTLRWQFTILYYHRLGFNRSSLINANCDFSLRLQLLVQIAILVWDRNYYNAMIDSVRVTHVLMLLRSCDQRWTSYATWSLLQVQPSNSWRTRTVASITKEANQSVERAIAGNHCASDNGAKGKYDRQRCSFRRFKALYDIGESTVRLFKKRYRHHVNICLPSRCVPHQCNNAYNFRITCIAMYSNSTALLLLVLNPKTFERRFITLKNDVGVQSRREMDEVWLAHSTAGVKGGQISMVDRSQTPAPYKNHAVGVIKCSTYETQLLNLQSTLKPGNTIILLRI